MHQRRPRGALFGVVVPAAVLVFSIGSQVSLEPDRPEPEVGTIDLAVDGTRWTSDPIQVDATALALTWDGADPSYAAVRVSDDGNTWGPWTDLDDEGDGPDPDSSEASGLDGHISEAVYVGDGGWLQFKVHGEPDAVGVAYVDTSGNDRSLPERVGDFFARVRFGQNSPALAAADQPPIIPRSEWGGDECRAANGGDPVNYHDGVEVMVVHHTVHASDSNSYAAADVADLLYAICSFHVGVRGWDDIGYNALIDRFGRIWEGRAGGIDQPVIGAHTGGFNSYSTGVALIGDFRQTIPSPEAEQALISYAAWKLDVHHVDPIRSLTVESLGSDLWPRGTSVTLRALSGHKDASVTSCPGDGVYYRLDGWAQSIAGLGGPHIYVDWPRNIEVPGSQVEGYTPTAFPFHFSEPMNWTFVVTDQDGVELHRQTGSGTAGSVTWTGTSGGVPLQHGQYTIHLDAVAATGGAVPRPAQYDFTLGDFEPPFADDEGSIHEADIQLIADLGVTTGCGPDRFCPGDDLTRWQMALFLTRLQTAAGRALPPGDSHGFTDIANLPADHQIAINQLATLGVTRGTGPDTFDPAGLVTREQMALFLIRWAAPAGIVLPDGSNHGFTDIGQLSPESQVAIGQLSQLGITTGTAPGLYTPNGLVTREQMASFLARTLRAVPGLSLPT